MDNIDAFARLKNPELPNAKPTLQRSMPPEWKLWNPVTGEPFMMMPHQAEFGPDFDHFEWIYDRGGIVIVHPLGEASLPNDEEISPIIQPVEPPADEVGISIPPLVLNNGAWHRACRGVTGY